MSTQGEWAAMVAQVIYEAYPDHDVLPIEPPRSGETISEFAYRAENAGDTLFLFLCREADEEIDAHVYLARLDRAIRDITDVQDAFRADSRPTCRDDTLSTADKPIDPNTAKKDVTIRLTLDADWIELAMTYADAQGRRTGSVTSSLHSSDADDDSFNAAMDAVESMVLGHACAGIDVTDPRYVEGIRTCVESCANNL